MKGQRVAAFGRPHPRRSLSDDGDLLAGKTRLVADHGAGAALALQAVAHGNARWFALNRKVKLPAAAGGASGHGSNSMAVDLGGSLRWTYRQCVMRKSVGQCKPARPSRLA